MLMFEYKTTSVKNTKQLSKRMKRGLILFSALWAILLLFNFLQFTTHTQSILLIMKKKIYIPSLLAAMICLFIFMGSSESPNNEAITYFKYVGIKSCAGACHKGDSKGRQLEIWQDSKHSQAFLTLQTPEADKIALDKGFTTPAAETPLCIKCHVLGKDINPEELDETFDKTQGVQCETCHGPGSEYKKLSIMKDKEQAIANGLVVNQNEAEFCMTCHNSDSPTFKSFNYEEYWAKIKHSDPNVVK